MNTINFFAISALINGIVSITFGILVISKNWRDRLNQIFFMMTISLAIWAFAYWQWQLSTDYNTAIMWVRILSAGSLFIPIFFYHWVIKLININTIVNRVILWFAYTAAIVILFFVNSSFFIANLQRKSIFQFWPNSGIAYDVYFSYIYFGLIIYIIYLLLRSYFTTKEENKKGQMLFIIIGCLLGFGGGLTNFPLWWGINISPIGNFLVAAFPFLLGYSVLKYKLFNIKVVATEMLTSAISVILLIRALVANNNTDRIIGIVIFFAVSIFGIMLVRSIQHEIEIREKIEKLAGDLKKANDDLETANNRLKELDQLKSEFLSMATHQIRAPLTAIKGYASLVLEGDYGEISEPIKKAVKIIFDSCQNLVVIVDDFLNISRIEQGRMKYDLTDFDIVTTVSEIINELKPNIENAKLSIDFKSDVPSCMIHADSGKTKQIVNNIIDNSIKYTKQGGIKVSILDGDKNVTIRISDTGIGIATEDIPKLFTKFTRAKDAFRTNVVGTGLGLYVAKQMAEAQGSRVWVESEGLGKGSTFFIELPKK